MISLFFFFEFVVFKTCAVNLINLFLFCTFHKRTYCSKRHSSYCRLVCLQTFQDNSSFDLYGLTLNHDHKITQCNKIMYQNILTYLTKSKTDKISLKLTELFQKYKMFLLVFFFQEMYLSKNSIVGNTSESLYYNHVSQDKNR